MPRLFQVVSRERLPNAPAVFAPAGFGQETARALERVGQAAGQVRKDLEAIKRHREGVFITKSLATLRSDATRDMLESRDRTEPGAPEFTKGLLQRHGDRLGKLMEIAPSGRARSILGAMAEGVRGSIEAKGLAFEVTERLKKRISDINESMRLSANTIISDPSQYKEAQTEFLEGLKQSGLPPRLLEAQVTAAKETFAGAFLLTMLEQNPAEVKQRLNSGEFDKVLTPSRKAMLLRRSNAKLKAQAAKAASAARATAIAQLKDELSSIQRTGDRLGSITDAQVVKVFGQEKGTKILNALKEEQEFFTVRERISGTTVREDNELLRQLRAEAQTRAKDDPGQLEKRQKRIDRLERAILTKRKVLARDPAAFVLTTNTEFATLLEQARGKPDKMASFATAMLEEQKRLGVPAHQRLILPKSSAATMIAEINAQGDPQKRGDMIASIAQQYGDQFPTLYKQLVKEGLSPGSSALFRLTNPSEGVIRRDMAEALKLGKTDLDKLLDKDQRDLINDALLDEAKNFRTSATSQAGGMVAFNREFESLSLLAKYYAARGDSPEDAARKAYKGLIGDKYTFIDRLRIPAKFAGPSGSSEAAQKSREFRTLLNKMVVNLDKLPIDWDQLPKAADKRLTEAQRRELFTRALISKGYWATNSDETGVILLDEKGQPIMVKGNKPLYVPFDVMSSKQDLAFIMRERFGITTLKPFVPKDFELGTRGLGVVP